MPLKAQMGGYSWDLSRGRNNEGILGQTDAIKSG